jgi:peptidyl-prolyl cis-trans isomerase A (cyclophilin A)
MKRLILLTAVFVFLFSPPARAGTVVRFDTIDGSFDVELYNNVTTLTVVNFLKYVQGGDYANTIIHRVPYANNSPFCVQGGGFKLAEDFPSVPAYGTVQNESQISNTRGTIAMARTSQLDSASSQWYVNVTDNPYLDNSTPQQPGAEGYTVFGEVLGDGMNVVDTIASWEVWDGTALHPHFGELPLRNYAIPEPLEDEYFVIIYGAAELTGGDANRDGLVGPPDLEILGANYNTAPGTLTTWGFGDFNADGIINVGDLGIMGPHYIAEGPGSGGAGGAIPEPGAFALLVLSAGAVLRRRRK